MHYGSVIGRGEELDVRREIFVFVCCVVSVVDEEVCVFHCGGEEGQHENWGELAENEQNCIPRIISTSALVALLAIGWNYRSFMSQSFKQTRKMGTHCSQTKVIIREPNVRSRHRRVKRVNRIAIPCKLESNIHFHAAVHSPDLSQSIDVLDFGAIDL